VLELAAKSERGASTAAGLPRNLNLEAPWNLSQVRGFLVIEAAHPPTVKALSHLGPKRVPARLGFLFLRSTRGIFQPHAPR
jgi:hypothetical protein